MNITENNNNTLHFKTYTQNISYHHKAYRW